MVVMQLTAYILLMLPRDLLRFLSSDSTAKFTDRPSSSPKLVDDPLLFRPCVVLDPLHFQFRIYEH